ncbi:hypothetical protein QYF36_014573 [Acer negundo]|nr:hypothetical protein QYF36_014573 [Acer negundo]
MNPKTTRTTTKWKRKGKKRDILLRRRKILGGCSNVCRNGKFFGSFRGPEHMLFVHGDYLSKHGGSSNAYTETEHTCYHFEVKPEFLKGALMSYKFLWVGLHILCCNCKSQCEPKWTIEFNQALQNDACRLQKLQCQTS